MNAGNSTMDGGPSQNAKTECGMEIRVQRATRTSKRGHPRVWTFTVTVGGGGGAGLGMG